MTGASAVATTGGRHSGRGARDARDAPRRHPAFPYLLLTSLLALTFVGAVQAGAVPVSGADWWSLLACADGQPQTGGAYVLWNIRLPRALLAVLVGAALGLSGALSQGLFRNPLADPGLLGVTSGAACAAALCIVMLSMLHVAVPPAWRLWTLPAAAFCGALLVCYTLHLVAHWISPGSIAGLLLTGVALNALMLAVMGLCTYLATDEQLRTIAFWTLGSLAGGGWLQVTVLTVALLLAAWPVQRLTRRLNALALGEAAAQHVGVDVVRLRATIIVLVALLTGLSVAWCGVIGFIGLMAPHIVRLWLGADQRRVLPLSMFSGALLLLLADTAARTVAIPAEIPVGIFTALLGAPFFLLLLSQSRNRIG
jgi:iron complex transport system permease protein